MSETMSEKVADWPDVAQFVQALHAPSGVADSRLLRIWNPRASMVLTRAPGRLDVMGGIADYSGSLVLQLTTREATLAALQRDTARLLTIVTSSEERDDAASVFTMPFDDFEADGNPITYDEARNYFRRDPDKSWAAYVAGAFLVLMREKAVVFPEGARLFIQSSLPEGKGVASSAALEVAAMMALDASFDIGLEERELALLCQKVETLVAGAPCGIMDQMSSVYGEANRFLALLCQPAEVQETVAVPEELAFWGIDSGIYHAVSGADYGSVRVGTFMGYRILKEIAGKDWGGYLANLTPSELEQKYLHHLPEAMLGARYIERYGDTEDAVTEVDPEATYRVRRPTTHPVYENFRVQAFARLLSGDATAHAPMLGELMYQSHASYSACGLGSEGTDRLVELSRAAGPTQGIFGAKITGGGSGGTIAILAHRDAEAAVRAIAEQYGRETSREPYIFAGSSSGAREFGHLYLEASRR